MLEKVKKLFVYNFALVGVLLILEISVGVFCGMFNIDTNDIDVQKVISVFYIGFFCLGQIFVIGLITEESGPNLLDAYYKGYKDGYYNGCLKKSNKKETTISIF